VQVRRFIAPALVVGLVLAGCGGGTDPLGDGDENPPPATFEPTATPTPFPSTGPLSEAEAKRLAALGVLTSTDMAGWDAAPRVVDPSDDEADARIKECLLLPSQPYFARDTGRTFTQGGVQVNSKVDVTASLAQADAELSAKQGPDGARCYREFLTKQGGGQLTLEVLPVTVEGADRVVAYRLVLSGIGPTGALAAGGYQLLAQVGQVEISLDTYEETSNPTFSFEKLVDLAEIVVARVKGTASTSPSPTPTSYVTFIPANPSPSNSPVTATSATQTPSP
jgi:hypothetical protein